MEYWSFTLRLNSSVAVPDYRQGIHKVPVHDVIIGDAMTCRDNGWWCLLLAYVW